MNNTIVSTSKKTPPTRKRLDKFAMFDLDTLRAMSELASTKSQFETALAVMHQRRLQADIGPVAFTPTLCGRFGITNRRTKIQNLEFWEAYGFWDVEKYPGKSPRVFSKVFPGRVVESAILRRATIESLQNYPLPACEVLFADGTTARTGAKNIRIPLARAHAAAGSRDVHLENRGTGWLVTRLEEASTEHLPLAVTRHIRPDERQHQEWQTYSASRP